MRSEYIVYDLQDNECTVMLGSSKEVAGRLNVTLNSIFVSMRINRPIKNRYKIEKVEEEK